jgi:hypothetical protein
MTEISSTMTGVLRRARLRAVISLATVLAGFYHVSVGNAHQSAEIQLL